MGDYHTIQDIEKHTGLTYAFIDRCTKMLNTILAPYMTRGDKNSKLFSTEGFVLFDRIKQLKESGMNIVEIKKRLEEDLKTLKTDYKQDSEHYETPLITTETGAGDVINIIQSYQRKIDEERNKTDREKEEKYKIQAELSERIKILEVEKETIIGNLKMLTSGKTPEQVLVELEENERKARAAWEENERKRIEIASITRELQGLSITQFMKRKKLLKRLEELTL